MKRIKRPLMLIPIYRMGKTFLILFAVVVLLPQISCTTKKCAMCDLDNTTIYNIELNKETTKNYKKQNFQTFFAPVPVETTGKKVNVYLVDCEGEEPYRLKHGHELEKFVKENMLIIDSLDINRITKTSDADIHPESFSVASLQDFTNLNLCKRSRNGFKIELRGMFGFRSFEKTTYEPIPGDIPLEKKILGFNEAGTMITIAPEVAFLPTLATYNDKHRLNLGILTGIWPVDGGIFVPLAIHPRFTFNDITNPLFGNCNTIYLFGDLGTAYDLKGSFSKFWSNKLNAYFYGLGAGTDLWTSRNMDFSIDFGYRRTTLPLPTPGGEDSDWINCINDHNIPYSSFPRRRTGQFFIRFGVTF